MKAQHRASQKWGMTDEPPNREPDFELHAWIEKGEVSWTWVGWPEGPFEAFDHGKRIAAITDAAWVYAKQREGITRAEQPALWLQLDNGGNLTTLYSTELFSGTNFRHALWLLRWWWRASVRWWRLAWRAARGQG